MHQPGEPEPHPDLKGPPEGTVPTAEEAERLAKTLRDAFRCPKCGRQKMHTRLRGLVCPSPRCG